LGLRRTRNMGKLLGPCPATAASPPSAFYSAWLIVPTNVQCVFGPWEACTYTLSVIFATAARRSWAITTPQQWTTGPQTLQSTTMATSATLYARKALSSSPCRK
jgi:hypothetical protein